VERNRVEEPLTIGIDARLRSGQPGGVEQFVIGLASGLSALSDGAERYLFLTLPGEDAWIRPYLRGSCALAQPDPGQGLRQWFGGTLPRRAVEKAPWLRRLRSGWRILRGGAAGVPRSDGTLESAGAQVIHFPLQSAFLTEAPSIYQPWDLQHLHLPEFFSSDVVATRERWYRAFCTQASLIVVATNWARRDLVARYGVTESKVAVIPVPPPIHAYASLSDDAFAVIRERLSLPAAFLFYPAQTWKHKNHIRLLEALAAVRDDHGVSIPVICSGRRNDHYPAIASASSRLRLDDSVRFVGYVESDELQALYRGSRALIFPSLFEGWGLPVVEAFASGLPVSCSRATSLPELVADAALTFDAMDPRGIAQAIWRIWTDDALRRELADRGKRRVRGLDWGRTARMYRAHYRSLSGMNLGSDDAALL
jgi:glycosyltransferase involved in cell wall biosynthesis